MLLNIILMVSVIFCLAAIVKVAYLKREEKHQLNSSFIREMPSITPNYIREFSGINVRYYREDSLTVGWCDWRKNLIMINIFDSSELNIACTLVHEYVHVWQHNNVSLLSRLPYKVLEAIKYGSSNIEKHAYIVEDMYSLCMNNKWNFDETIIPFVWNELKTHKYDEAYDNACKFCYMFYRK